MLSYAQAFAAGFNTAVELLSVIDTGRFLSAYCIALNVIPESVYPQVEVDLVFGNSVIQFNGSSSCAGFEVPE